MLENWEKMYNMKVTVMSIIIDELTTIPRRLVKGLDDWLLKGQVETIKTTTLF